MPVGKPEVMTVKIFEQDVANFFTQAVAAGEKLLFAEAGWLKLTVNEADVVVEGIYPAVLATQTAEEGSALEPAMAKEVDGQAVLKQALARGGTKDDSIVIEVDEVLAQAFEIDQIHLDGR